MLSFKWRAQLALQPASLHVEVHFPMPTVVNCFIASLVVQAGDDTDAWGNSIEIVRSNMRYFRRVRVFGSVMTALNSFPPLKAPSFLCLLNH